jgi:hypothetical protein
MSGRGRKAAPVVVREYRHSQDECIRALALVLKKAISNMAAERPLSLTAATRRRSGSMVDPRRWRTYGRWNECWSGCTDEEVVTM